MAGNYLMGSGNEMKQDSVGRRLRGLFILGDLTSWFNLTLRFVGAVWIP